MESVVDAMMFAIQWAVKVTKCPSQAGVLARRLARYSSTL